MVEIAFGPEVGLRAGQEALREPSLLASLVIVARYRGIHLTVRQLIRDNLLGPGEPSLETLAHIARANGLRGATLQLSVRALMKLGPALPSILLLRNGSAMVLLRTDEVDGVASVVLQDPNAGDDALLTLDERRLAAAWSGQVILLKRDHRLQDADQPFGLRLIMSYILRDRRIAREILISAFLISLLGLAPIMFWRLLLDRVLYFQAFNTFAVLCTTMAVLIVFETAFSHLRRHLVNHLVKKVDVKLSIQMFSKILNLPIEFFERNPTGQIMRDMSEMWKIRQFLTTTAFGTALDALVIIVILPILFLFNTWLTLMVLGIAGLICLWLVLMLPEVHRKAGLVFRAEGVKSSFLVESLHGIRTVKSLALDAKRRQEWDVYVTRAAKLRFDEAQTANLIQTVVLPLERLMTSGVFALAIYLSLSGKDQAAVGSLVAFMMLTMRLSGPLNQLAALLPQYDEVRLAVSVLGAMVNAPPEEGRSKAGVRTPLTGRIEFSGVRFRYSGATMPALDNVSFLIPEGTIFGVMGRSGSGKTTVTRLLQMLHTSYEGLIKIDGMDLRAIDLDHLRSSIGVVLQENFLFRGTIRETIASAKPDATLEQVIEAARLAGAEEFIERLPNGYDTWLQEGSTNLSGGQRQRLAIARALITNPRILILDEATSALDAESEAIVNANLLSIAKSRTLLIISHRLSALADADAILVLERGCVYDIGRHEELLERCDIYSALWNQQHRHLLTRAESESA